MIRVGPAGWSYADWQGIVYPRRKPAGFHPLSHLARFVDCVEINSSFYALPRREHVANWARLVASRPDFSFTAKLHRDFTHSERTPVELEQQAEALREVFEPLRGALAALLAQFPVSFRESASALERLSALRAMFAWSPLVLELRHASWFTGPALAHVERLDCSLAEIDLPQSPQHPPAAHPTPGRIGYLRLHGRNSAAWFERHAHRDRKYDYLYSPRELAQMVERARRLAGTHDQTFVITNNHFEGKALANALEILSSLREARVDAPPELVERYPHLAAIARVAGQRELF